MSIIGRCCRGRSGEYSSTGRFPLSFAWISGGGSDELPAARGISSPISASPPSTFTSTASPSRLCSPSPYSLATALTSSQPWFCSSCDIWVTPVCVLLLRECQKVRSQQELIFLAALCNGPCGVGDFVNKILYALVFTSNPSGSLGFCSRGSGWGGTSACGIDGPAFLGGAFPSSKALSMCPNPKPPYFISACSLIDSSLNVQDRKAGISGTALAARFVISICPIGSQRVAATSAAVIWIDCPFWICKVQLLGSKFSTNHNPNLRALPIVGQHAPRQAAEFVLLLARVQSLFWVPLLWMSPPVQLLFFCCLHDIFNLN
nr:hypothetical protein Iba_chr04aCG15020 [Ipomoea batatas]